MVGATAASVAWWAGTDVSRLLADPNIGRGEVWRLLTCTFLHKDVFHLLFNLYWLVVLGITVESALGWRNMLWISLLLAFGSSAAEYALLEGGVGLSGGGYGLFGLIWVLSRRDARFRGTLDRRTNWLFVGWFAFCILTTVTGVWQVGNVAHGAGAVLGALLGLTMTVPNRYRSPLRFAFAAACLASLFAATLLRPWVNISPHAGEQQALLCYRALESRQNGDAVRWGREAVSLRPQEASFWFNLYTPSRS